MYIAPRSSVLRRSVLVWRRSAPLAKLSIATPRGAYSIDNACHCILSPPACILVSTFWVYVFFSGDRQPADIDLIRASFLLAEIDSRQHAAGQPSVHAARGGRVE